MEVLLMKNQMLKAKKGSVNLTFVDSNIKNKGLENWKAKLSR